MEGAKDELKPEYYDEGEALEQSRWAATASNVADKPVMEEANPDFDHSNDEPSERLEETTTETVTAEAIPAVDPFTAIVGVPDAVLLTCPVASKNLGLVNVPGTIVAADAAIDVQFPMCRVTTSRDNLKIITNG